MTWLMAALQLGIEDTIAQNIANRVWEGRNNDVRVRLLKRRRRNC